MCKNIWQQKRTWHLERMTSRLAWLESKGQAAFECIDKEEMWLEKWAKEFR